MKIIKIFILLAGVILLHSCKDEVFETYNYQINEPIFKSADEFRKSVAISPFKKVEKPGKIVFYKDFLFISEAEKGIHVFNNMEPKRPVPVAFIELPGNTDLAVKGTLLYADSYVDLVWFDISDPQKPTLKGRKGNIFPTALPATDNIYPIDYEMSMDKSKGVVVGWKLSERSGSYPKDYYFRDEAYAGNGIWMLNSGMSESTTQKITGKPTSVAQFAIVENLLYTNLTNQFGVYDITSEIPQSKAPNVFVDNTIETILSSKDKLYIGTPSGVVVFSIKEPAKPTRLTTIKEITGCNPMAAENDWLFATSNTENPCGGSKENGLLIYNVVGSVSDQTKPGIQDMRNPKGIAVDRGILFVSNDGLKVYNAKNPYALTVIDNKETVFRGDKLTIDTMLKRVWMTGSNAIYQYDYAVPERIIFLSQIEIGN